MPVACPRREVRSGCAARTASAQRMHPFSRTKNAGYRKVICVFASIEKLKGFEQRKNMGKHPQGG